MIIVIILKKHLFHKYQFWIFYTHIGVSGNGFGYMCKIKIKLAGKKCRPGVHLDIEERLTLGKILALDYYILLEIYGPHHWGNRGMLNFPQIP